MSRRGAVAVAMVLCACWPAVAGAAFDVKVDLENVSGEDKADWPVILTVCQVLGRNLPADGVNPKGFHVYDETGKEIPCAIETQYPDLHPGGYELIFVIPKMARGAKATYRVTNTRADSASMKAIDVVGNPSNLIADGGFEGAPADVAKRWRGACKVVTDAKRSGKAALSIAGVRGVRIAYTEKIPLHKGSWYYAGVWSKTHNVARYGVAAGSGGYFRMTGLAKQNTREPAIAPTCYTRDWNKLRLFGRYQLHRSDWGVNGNTVQATGDAMSLQIGLDQKKQFTMTDARGQWWLDDLVIMEQPKVTVRFDRLLAPLMKDGYFLFTRPTSAPIGDPQPPASAKNPRQGWATKPFPHEAVERIDRIALTGQRALYLVGLYHTRAMSQVKMTVVGGALTGAGGVKIPVETVEFSHGILGKTPHYYLIDQTAPVDFPGPAGQRYFLATFLVPRDAKPGKYAGGLVVSEADKTLKTIPITLAVQDLAQPIIKDRWVGSIFQASPMVFTPETIRVYGRGGFTCVTIFGGFLRYVKSDDGLMHVDLKDLAEKMALLKENGIAAVSLYSELQLDDKPRGPGRMARYMYREAGADKECQAPLAALRAAQAEKRKARDAYNKDRADAAAKKAYEAARQAEAVAARKANAVYLPAQKAAYARMIKEMDDACRKHPDWPIIIHMNWDEPGGPNPKMGWTNEILPHVETTADLGFGVIARCSKYYTMPCIDDPADFSGPELYAWIKAQGKKVGIAASARKDEFARYQLGVLVASADIRYVHSWHIAGLMAFKKVDGKRKCLRSLGLVAAGEGMDDLKAVTLLRQAIANANAGTDRAAKAKAAKAQKFLDATFKVWNGDHLQASGNPPFFGLACYWGYDGFYDDFQRQVLRHAADVAGVKWID